MGSRVGSEASRVGRAVIALLLSMTLPACGSRVAPEGAGGPAAAGAGMESAAAAVPEPGPGAGAGTGTAPGSDGQVTGEGAAPPQFTYPPEDEVMTPPPDDGDESWWRPGPQPPPPGYNTVGVRLSKPCASVGELQEAMIDSKRPRAGLTMIVAYSDHRSHGAHGFGDADAQGRYVWRFVVPPDAPPGKAVVMVGATGPDWSSEGGGSGQATFEVAGAGGCGLTR